MLTSIYLVELWQSQAFRDPLIIAIRGCLTQPYSHLLSNSAICTPIGSIVKHDGITGQDGSNVVP